MVLTEANISSSDPLKTKIVSALFSFEYGTTQDRFLSGLRNIWLCLNQSEINAED